MAFTFTWTPSTSGKNSKPATSRLKFADGYEQRLSESINNIPRVFNQTFKGGKAKIDAIEKFLDDVGISAFAYTPLGAALPMSVTCTKRFQRVRDGFGAHSITLQFEQDFWP